jgi:hypothetical protein
LTSFISYLDFAKAFDKVPIKRLLKKVRAHGIHGQVLHWIESWLRGRRQRVVLNGKFSSWEEVLSGVPQGSVLGPLLFVIFINDMDDMVSQIDTLKKFADDTKLGKTVRTEKDREELQEALDQLCAWADKWGMVFNVGKCKVMHMGHQNPAFNYTMKGQVLEETKEEKDIGVMVTSNLKTHCAMCPGCENGSNNPRTTLAHIPLQRQAYISSSLQAVCAAASGIFHPGLGTLDGGRQELPREGTAKSYQDGFRAQE